MEVHLEQINLLAHRDAVHIGSLKYIVAVDLLDDVITSILSATSWHAGKRRHDGSVWTQMASSGMLRRVALVRISQKTRILIVTAVKISNLT
jgi:hypothetical protein